MPRTIPRLAAGWPQRIGPDCAFPIQNLPFGVFRRKQTAERFRGGVAIGDQIIDLAALAEAQLIRSARQRMRFAPAAQPSLNALMQLGPRVWSALRRALFDAAAQGSALRRLTAGLPGAAARRSLFRCRHRSATTPISTHRFITRRRSGGCSGRTIRCCRTTNGFPSATTAAARPSACPARASRGRGDSERHPAPPRPASARASAWTTSSKWASSSAAAMRWARPSRWTMPKSISSACACSMIGRRGICKPGSTNPWVRFWQRTSPPRSRPGW